MSKHTAGHLSQWISELCQRENVLWYKAHFLGGEPFLKKELLFFLIEKLQADLPSHTKGHPDGQFVVFTNGDEIDGATLKRCKQYKVKIILNPTSDDLVTVHEKIHFIKTLCGGCSLAVVADEINLPRLPQLAALAVSHNGHIRINRLYDGGRNQEYIETFRKQMHKVFDILLSAEIPMWPNFILESTYPLWEDERNPHACGRWLLVFDPDGNIRSCNADMTTVIGNIFTTKPSMSEFKFTHRWSSKGLEGCHGCEWAIGGWCQGGCPFTRKLTYGTYTHNTPFCEAFKELFPRLKELTQRWKVHYGLE